MNNTYLGCSIHQRRNSLFGRITRVIFPHYSASMLVPYLINRYCKKKDGLTVLFIGAGDGNEVPMNCPNIKRTICVDYDDTYGQAFIDNGIEFYKADMNQDKIPVPEKSIDLVIAMHVIEHISNWNFLYSEIGRIIKPGGVLYVRTPDIQRTPSFYDDATHVKPYTKRGVSMALNMFGFDCISNRNAHYQILMFSVLSGVWFIQEVAKSLPIATEIEAIFVKHVLTVDKTPKKEGGS